MTSTDPVVKVARDLTEILELTVRLASQAQYEGNSRLMPGGTAQVALGPEGSIAEWGELLASDELRHLSTCPRTDHSRCSYDWRAVDEDDQDHEPPLQTLLFWSEAWRDEHGYPLEGRRPTIVSEARLIRHLLDWAWVHEVHWDDFARDVNRARVRLEDVLHAGRRAERSRVVCDRCDAVPRLIVLRGVAQDNSDDRWKCPACKHRFDSDELARAHARQLRSEGAERWVHQADAIGTLRAQGRSDRTVRAWLAEGEGSAYCNPTTHEVWVWWPDLWRKHLTTPTRRRARSA